MSEPVSNTAATTAPASDRNDWADAAFRRLKEQDRKTRQTTILLTFIPILVAAGLIYFTSRQVESAIVQRKEAEAQRELALRDLAQTRDQIEAAQSTVKMVKQELAEARTLADTERIKAEQVTNHLKEVERQLKEVGSLAPFTHRIGPEDMKGMFGTNPSRVVDAVNEMLNLKEHGTAFNISGKEIKEGLNSPMFMAHMLSKSERFKSPDGTPLVDYARDLFQRLPGETITQSQLQPGDLVVYETDYVMMYAKDYQGQPFVIGMTPAGILPLEANFAKQKAWYKGIGR